MKKRITGAELLERASEYLKEHPGTTGIQAANALGIASSSISNVFKILHDKGLAVYDSGKRGAKFWTWCEGGKPPTRTYVYKKTVKTRPISDINQQIAPPEALI